MLFEKWATLSPWNGSQEVELNENVIATQDVIYSPFKGAKCVRVTGIKNSLVALI
jgi:hypothetical protein